MSHQGYAKSQPVDAYRAQRRGGRGKTATATKDEDFVEKLFVANTHDTILCFSSRGKCYWLKVYELPQAGHRRLGGQHAGRQLGVATAEDDVGRLENRPDLAVVGAVVMSRGADGIITDEPALAVNLLEQRRELKPGERALLALAELFDRPELLKDQ